MAKRKPEAVRRQKALERTLARFRNKSFDWAGGRTCVHLARWHLKHMGHTVPPVPKVDSAAAARRALKERGWQSLTEMMDNFAVPIAPALMTLGDIMAVEGDHGMDAIFICAGPRRAFGWREDCPCPVMLEIPYEQLKGAWRV